MNRRRDRALEEVAAFLDKDSEFERVSPGESVLQRSRVLLGEWKTIYPFWQGRHLHIVLPEYFPDEYPHLILDGDVSELWRDYPHIERNGKLCLISNSSAINSDSPVSLIKDAIFRAKRILTEPAIEDHRDEALIYWSLSLDDKKYSAVSCDSSLESMERCVTGVLGEKLVLAANEKNATVWLKNSEGEKAKFRFFAPSFVVRLPLALTPKDYPLSPNNIRFIVQKYATLDVKKDFEELLFKTGKLYTVVMVQHCSSGTALTAVIGYGLNVAKSKSVNRGFRPGKVPVEIMAQRSSNSLNMETIHRVNVNRVDAKWIHTRGGDGSDLSEKKIVLIGCGSLGGYVAHLLARTGIGALTFLDNDILEWANVGRHILGASSVGKSKSQSIEKQLKKELPHLALSSFFGDWREWVKNKSAHETILGSDLIISTVADWSCERPLNFFLREHSKTSIFTWLEPYGFAGHILTVAREGGCLECGMDSFGRFCQRATEFHSDTYKKEPGGCAYYQQYGPTKLMALAARVAENAVRALTNAPSNSSLETVLSEVDRLSAKGGKLTKAYKDALKGDGQIVLSSEWKIKSECKCCSVING